MKSPIAARSQPRRRFRRMAIAALLGPAIVASMPARSQSAETYPSRTVTVVTPFSVGSGPDAVIRLVADKLSALWQRRVVVDNRPGAAGFIAIDIAKRAAPDGYTLLQLDSEQLAALPFLYKQRGYRPFESFEPIAALFRTPFMIVLPADAKAASVDALLAAARTAPGGLLYGSWGIGSPGHLGAVALEAEAGVAMRHIPYKEMSQLFLAVGANDVAWSFGSLASSQAAYKLGKVKYLAVAASQRLKQLPQLPTVAQAGGPRDFTLDSFAALLAPKGIDPKIAARVHADVLKVLADPDILSRFDTFAFESLSWDPAEIRRQADRKASTYAKLIQRANISLD